MSQTAFINPRSIDMDMHRLGRRLRDSIGDTPIVVKFSEQSETRRIQQNRLLWMWHQEFTKHIQEHQGQTYSTDDIHDYVVGTLLPKRVVTVFGEPEIKRTETKKLNVKDFSNFLNAYDMWAADKYNCMFTRPDDLYWTAVMKEAA